MVVAADPPERRNDVSLRIVGSVSAAGTMSFNDTTPTCATHVPDDRIAS